LRQQQQHDVKQQHCKKVLMPLGYCVWVVWVVWKGRFVISITSSRSNAKWNNRMQSTAMLTAMMTAMMTALAQECT
jgi:hypothetical protein